MRLTEEEHLAISDTIHQADGEAMIYLFGSRVDDSARGGWADATEMIKIGELRNLIAHEYANDKMPEIYAAVAAMSPAARAIVPKVITYANDITIPRMWLRR